MIELFHNDTLICITTQARRIRNSDEFDEVR